VPLTKDQHTVGHLAPSGDHERFGIGVRPGASGRDLYRFDADVGQERVERGREVRSAVPDEEPGVLEPLAEAEGEVAGLLHCPFTGRVGSNAAQMHPAGAMLDEHGDVQPLQQHGVHVEGARETAPGIRHGE
jgi:hypothetical protein